MPRPRRSQAFTSNPNLPPVIVGDGPDPEADLISSLVDGERRFVIRERQVDRFTVIRKRVELTPAVCDVCGTDFVTVNRSHLSVNGELPDSFEDLSDQQKSDMKALVAEHKRLHHTAADRHIVTESELPREWLGRRS
jgi:hypothetical protein